MVGVDVLGHVIKNLTKNVHDERPELRLPEFLSEMLERKWIGDKTGGGFYRKNKSADKKEDDRLALDWHTLEYRPRKKVNFAALEMTRNVDEIGQRLRMLLGLPDPAASGSSGLQKNDKAGRFLWT